MVESRRPEDLSGGMAPGGPAPGTPAPGRPTPGTPAPGVPAPGVPGAPGPVSTRQEKVDLINRFYEAANRRDYRTMQSMMGEQHLDRTWFGSSPVRPQAVTRMYAMFQDVTSDWEETVDEIIAVDQETGWVVFRTSGRGTFDGEFLDRKPTGQQIGVSEIHCVRIVGSGANARIAEYRQHKHGMFENPFDERITAPADLQAVRAEQGGGIETAPQLAERERILSAYARGEISAQDLSAGLSRVTPPERCQALLRENFRRCVKPAVANSIYCEVHSRGVDTVHTV